MLAGLVQLVLIQDDVKHFWWTLLQLFGCDHLHIEVPRLGLAARLDESLQDFGRGDLEVHDYWRQGGLGQLRGVIDGIAVENNQLHTTTKLKNSLNFGLHFGQVGRAETGLVQDGLFGGVVEHGLFAQTDVGRDAGDYDTTSKFILEVLENGLLHHVSDLVAFEARPYDDQRPDGRHNVIWRKRFLLFAKETLFLLDHGWSRHPHPTPSVHPILVHRHLGQGPFRVVDHMLQMTSL